MGDGVKGFRTCFAQVFPQTVATTLLLLGDDVTFLEGVYLTFQRYVDGLLLLFFV